MSQRLSFLPERIAPTAYIAPGAQVLGNVTIGAESSVWCNAVIRSDAEAISIGTRTNVQDLCVLHVDVRRPCTLGDRVSLGHGAIVHGAVVEDDVLIGMGAIVLNDARIGAGSIVAAGSVVPEGMQVPPGSIVMGTPARVHRTAEARDTERIQFAARYYADLAHSCLNPPD
jgi:carbonic anhydrase/acetyltransferase-like protein (isoleucine patch superfamily)